MPVLLLLLFSVAVSIGIGVIVLVVRRGAKKPRLKIIRREPSFDSCLHASCLFQRPSCWLAIRGRSVRSVQAALGLHNTKPCSWIEGLAGDEKMFVAPPVKGWILVMGSGLPEPGDDVDTCFRFMVEVSRKLGQVQLFWADRVLHYHGWVRADGGRILRAYAWGGSTLWQQGARTSAETELGLVSLNYFQTSDHTLGQPDPMALNTEKLPLLAARWSLDPARIDQHCLATACGIAGEPSRRY